MERLKNGIMNGYPNYINNFKYMMHLDSSEVAKIIWIQLLYSIPFSVIVAFLFAAIAVATETEMTFQVILAGFLLSPILLEMAVDKFKEKKND
jgi:ATP/ADP translocase